MGLHIITCIKSVITKAPDDKIIRSPESCQLNPFDRPALEVAISLKETYGGTVTALSMGPEFCSFTLHEAISMGADRGILICDKAFAGSDTLATSTTIGAALKKLAPFDMILFGTRTSDSDTGQVGPQTATFLDIPIITWATKITRGEDSFNVERSIDGFKEIFEVSLPFAMTIHPRSVMPRDIGLSGIENSYGKKRIEILNLLDLNLLPSQTGDEGSPTRVISMKKTAKKKKCEFISGTVDEQVQKLTDRLRTLGMI